MSERWKTQLIQGGFWGLFMLVFMTLFDEKPVTEQISSRNYLIKVVIYMATGIFFMGYIFWKGKNPENTSWSAFFGKKKKG